MSSRTVTLAGVSILALGLLLWALRGPDGQPTAIIPEPGTDRPDDAAHASVDEGGTGAPIAHGGAPSLPAAEGGATPPVDGGGPERAPSTARATPFGARAPSPATDRPASDRFPGTIAGVSPPALVATIVGDDGRPAVGARVRWVADSGDPRRTRRGLSGPEGDLRIPGVPVENGSLVVEHRDYLAMRLPLLAGERGPMEIELASGGRIEGWIVEDGDHLADAVVLLRGENLSRTAVSDEEGGFHFQGLGPGSYSLRVTAIGHAALEESGGEEGSPPVPKHEPVPVVVGADGDLQEVEIVLGG